MSELTFLATESRGADRVRAHTAGYVNARIDRLTRAEVNETISHGDAAIRRRLLDLDSEWDVDRALMAFFAVAGSLFLTLGMGRRRGFLYLVRAQLAFLLGHATYGWCPPLGVFRRLGFRTTREIERERRLLESTLSGERAEVPAGTAAPAGDEARDLAGPGIISEPSAPPAG